MSIIREVTCVASNCTLNLASLGDEPDSTTQPANSRNNIVHFLDLGPAENPRL